MAKLVVLDGALIWGLHVLVVVLIVSCVPL